MLAKSHMALGFLGGVGICYLPFDVLQSEFYLKMLLPIVIIGSIFPDIDEPRSFIGRKLPVLSHIINLSFSHRGFTHFLLFPLLISLLGLFLFHRYEILSFCLFALSFGILIHQIGDMLTVSGISHYFFPLSTKKAVLLPRFLRFRTGSAIEKSILYGIFIPLTGIVLANKFELFGSFDFNDSIKLIGELL